MVAFNAGGTGFESNRHQFYKQFIIYLTNWRKDQNKEKVKVKRRRYDISDLRKHRRWSWWTCLPGLSSSPLSSSGPRPRQRQTRSTNKVKKPSHWLESNTLQDVANNKEMLLTRSILKYVKKSYHCLDSITWEDVANHTALFLRINFKHNFNKTLSLDRIW